MIPDRAVPPPPPKAWLIRGRHSFFDLRVIVLALAVGLFAGCVPPAIPERYAETFDAGPVFAAVTPTLTHQFRVQNTTGHPVRILDEKHSCECTEVILEQREVPPGGSVTLTLNVSVPPIYAKKGVSCTLTTDDPDHRDRAYQLGFESFPRAQIVPDRIDLGTYSVSDMLGFAKSLEPPSREVWLDVFVPRTERGTGALLQPRLTQIPEECRAAIGDGPEVSTPVSQVLHARYRLLISLKRHARSAGTFVRPISFSTADGMGASAAVSWTVRAPVNCSPSQIHFGSVGVGDAALKRRVILSSSDGGTFRITSVDSPAFLRVNQPQGTATSSPANSTHELDITFGAPHQESSRFLAGTIRFRTDRADYPEVLLAWSAFLRKP